MSRCSPAKGLADIFSRRFRRILTGRAKNTIHFLHIGKNAGNQIKLIIKQINAQCHNVHIRRHGHRVSLRDIAEDDAYFFSIRNPVTRFRSGFYSRKRKGLPRKLIDWNRHEAKAFSDFEHANELAEALFSGGVAGANAFGAMKSISHVSMNQVDWFSRVGNMLEIRPPLCIIRQEKFESDILALKVGIDFEGEFRIEKDPVKSHINDYSDLPEFSQKALSNLARWYVQDFELYKACEEWIERNQQK